MIIFLNISGPHNMLQQKYEGQVIFVHKRSGPRAASSLINYNLM